MHSSPQLTCPAAGHAAPRPGSTGRCCAHRRLPCAGASSLVLHTGKRASQSGGTPSFIIVGCSCTGRTMNMRWPETSCAPCAARTQAAQRARLRSLCCHRVHNRLTSAAGCVALLRCVSDLAGLLRMDGRAADAPQLQRLQQGVHPDVVQADLPAHHGTACCRLLPRQMVLLEANRSCATMGQPSVKASAGNMHACEAARL